MKMLDRLLRPYAIKVNPPMFSRNGKYYVVGGSYSIVGAAEPERECVPEDADELAQKIDAAVLAGGHAVGLPPLPEMMSYACARCRGTGRVAECKVCLGHREHECRECGAIHDCGHCAGSGVVPAPPGTGTECMHCYGLGGLYPEGYRISIGEYRFAARLLKPFVDLGMRAEIVEPSETSPCKDGAVLVFSGNGVSALVAGLRMTDEC